MVQECDKLWGHVVLIMFSSTVWNNHIHWLMHARFANCLSFACRLVMEKTPHPQQETVCLAHKAPSQQVHHPCRAWSMAWWTSRSPGPVSIATPWSLQAFLVLSPQLDLETTPLMTVCAVPGRDANAFQGKLCSASRLHRTDACLWRSQLSQPEPIHSCEVMAQPWCFPPHMLCIYRFAGPGCEACNVAPTTNQICPGGSRDPPKRCPSNSVLPGGAPGLDVSECLCIPGSGRPGGLCCCSGH